MQKGKVMIEFEVKDVTCGHCVATVTKAVEAVAASAQVQVDLDTHVVRVEGAPDADAVESAIREAGYTPVRK